MTLSIPFDNSYARLPDRFYTKMAPTPVRQPELLALNAPLAADLGLGAFVAGPLPADGPVPAVVSPRC